LITKVLEMAIEKHSKVTVFRGNIYVVQSKISTFSTAWQADNYPRTHPIPQVLIADFAHSSHLNPVIDLFLVFSPPALWNTPTNDSISRQIDVRYL